MASIGIFDSGLGGLSVWKEVSKLLPPTRLVYFADQGRCPYGPQPPQKIREYAHQITDFLIRQGCELIVLACNTATAAAIASLRNTYQIPFVGMEPALKPAALQTQSGQIAILATAGTFNGDHFRRTQAAYGQGVHIHLIVEEQLVEIVENDQIDSPASQALLKSILIPALEMGADQIVLGCTHYPFLIPQIEEVVENRAKIIDPSQAVAMQVKRLWEKNQLNLEDENEIPVFFTSGNAKIFTKKLRKMLGQSLPQHIEIRQHRW